MFSKVCLQQIDATVQVFFWLPSVVFVSVPFPLNSELAALLCAFVSDDTLNFEVFSSFDQSKPLCCFLASPLS